MRPDLLRIIRIPSFLRLDPTSSGCARETGSARPLFFAQNVPSKQASAEAIVARQKKQDVAAASVDPLGVFTNSYGKTTEYLSGNTPPEAFDPDLLILALSLFGLGILVGASIWS